jgi:hypothetical protein
MGTITKNTYNPYKEDIHIGRINEQQPSNQKKQNSKAGALVPDNRTSESSFMC